MFLNYAGVNTTLIVATTNSFFKKNPSCVASSALLTPVSHLVSTGKYCIYRKGGSCPANMTSGYYYWNDEYYDNTNSQGGVYPDGEYTHNTQLYFCCRTDGDKSIPIALPTSKPFFLLAQGSSQCQQVKWALATTEWLIYDTAGSGKRGAVFPYNSWLKKDPKIYYCYYQSKYLTLTQFREY